MMSELLHGTSFEAGYVAPPRSFNSEARAGSSEPVRPLPASAYQSLAFQAKEDAAIWTRSWVCVGFDADVAMPGDILPFTVGNHGIHVERLEDGTIAGRFNKAQHGGCRAVPLQCQTGTKTRCSFTACGYSRDRKPIGAADPDRLIHLDQYLGLRPERLLPVAVRVWGPLIFANLDPNRQCDFDGPAIVTFVTDTTTGEGGETHWIEYAANWKYIAVALAQGNHAGFATSSILFPNVIVFKNANYSCFIILQPTGLEKTLCRLRFIGRGLRKQDVSDALIGLAVKGRRAEALQSERKTPAELARNVSHPTQRWFEAQVRTRFDALDEEGHDAVLYQTDHKGGW